VEHRLNAEIDRQLEAATRFSATEREFEQWRQSEEGSVLLENSHPAPVHDFMRFFATRGSAHYQASLARLTRYRPMIERTFAEEGVPPEMLWVGLVESGYDPLARSPKDAVGMWQFITGTAKRFGLQVSGRDERIDPVKSTRAAGRYLKVLYQTFSDWPLALAAYNAGENRVAAAIERTGVRDFWQLARLGELPRETQNYVPAVLAAGMMEEQRSLANRVPANASADRTPGRYMKARPIVTLPAGGGDGL
jgi:hypothetical protein